LSALSSERNATLFLFCEFWDSFWVWERAKGEREKGKGGQLGLHSWNGFKQETGKNFLDDFKALFKDHPFALPLSPFPLSRNVPQPPRIKRVAFTVQVEFMADIVDIAVGAGSFSTLVTAVQGPLPSLRPMTMHLPNFPLAPSPPWCKTFRN
jgi:hypothetical protein